MQTQSTLERAFVRQLVLEQLKGAKSLDALNPAFEFVSLAQRARTGFNSHMDRRRS